MCYTSSKLILKNPKKKGGEKKMGMALVLLGSLLVFVLLCKLASKYENIPATIAAVILGFVLVIILIGWPLTYVESIGKVAKMEAFYNATKSAYEYTINSSQQLQIKQAEILKGEMVDLTYMKQGTVVSERMKEFRDAVRHYNAELAKNRKYNSYLIMKDWVADAPEELKYIILK